MRLLPLSFIVGCVFVFTVPSKGALAHFIRTIRSYHILEVIFQKQVQVLHWGFQTREN